MYLYIIYIIIMNKIIKICFILIFSIGLYSCSKDTVEIFGEIKEKNDTENPGDENDEKDENKLLPDFKVPIPYKEAYTEKRDFNAQSNILTLSIRDVCHFGTIKEISNAFVKPGVFYDGDAYTNKGNYVVTSEINFAPCVLYFDDNTNVQTFSVDIENPNEMTIKKGIHQLVQENFNQETKARISQRIEEIHSITEISRKVGFNFTLKDFSLGSGSGQSLNTDKRTFLCEVEQIYYTLALFPKSGKEYYDKVGDYNSEYAPLVVNKIHFGRLFYLLLETEKTVGVQDVSNVLDFVIGKVSNSGKAREILSKSRVHITIYGGSSELAQSTINGNEVPTKIGPFFSNPTTVGGSNSLPVSYGLVDARTGNQLDYVFINETKQEIKVEAQTYMVNSYIGGLDDWKSASPMRYQVEMTTIVPMLPIKDITFNYSATAMIGGNFANLTVNANDIRFSPQDFYLYNDIYVAKRKINVTLNRGGSYKKMHPFTIRIDASPIVLPTTTIPNRSIEILGSVKYYIPFSVSILQ